ncbi:MAG TPA: dipeptide epimerase [Candidatus Baltobacteraceae bacterium]|jgi:L-alanine-DL-glutamate epimerase-like enolase superfamily enzyme|nr:dipeptide epimerase [Candidatus Baltobacteraceae bacterium]
MSLSLSTTPLELALVHPFRIARTTEDAAHTVVFRLTWNGLEGIGESVPIERYGESVESVIDYFTQHPLAADDPYLLEDLLHAGIPPAARCGLDIALHDLVGKDCGKPLYRLFGLDPDKTPVTSFTVGIADPETTLRKVRDIGDHPVLKVKLGAGTPAEEIETLEMIRSAYAGTIRIDANEGWTVEDAVAVLREIDRLGIEFCEQPIPAGHPEQLRYIKEHSPIPIVTDEDSLTAADLPALYGCVDGINVKLAKTGGIRGALAMIHTARALRMKIMLGCMVESQISAAAAAHISALVDWADLDGPFLTKDDPFTGIVYENGKIVLPDGAGLGVAEKTAVA